MSKFNVLSEHQVVNIDEAKELIKICTDQNIREPIMILGQPGVGKSAVIRQIVNERDRELKLEILGSAVPKDPEELEVKLNEIPEQYGLVDVRLSTMAPEDMRGIPIVVTNEDGTQITIWAIPSFLPKSGWRGIVFFDELNSANKSVLAAQYQITLDRRLGEYILPDGASIVAAGNRRTDHGVVTDIPSPLADRFTFLEVTVDSETYLRYATQNNIHQSVLSFISLFPEHLSNFEKDPKSLTFSTPRSWDVISKFTKTVNDIQYLRTLVAGRVGFELATLYINHHKLSYTLPNPRVVLAGKFNFNDIPTDRQELFQMNVSLCSLMHEFHKLYKQEKINHSEWNAICVNYLKFLLSIPQTKDELPLGFYTWLTQKYKIVTTIKSPEFREFCVRYRDKLRSLREELLDDD